MRDRGMEWDGLTTNAIRAICNTKSYSRGQIYYRNERIVAVNLNGDGIRSAVEGTRRYIVNVSPGRGDRIVYHCTCPYDWGGACKHVVATLLHTMEHYEEMAEATRKAQEEIAAMLKEATPKYMRQFLAGAMAGDSSLAKQFGKGMNRLPPIGADYGEKIDELLGAAWRGGGGYVWYGGYDGEDEDEDEDNERRKADLEPVTSIARQFEEAKNYSEAARIYGEIAGAVAAKSRSGHRRGMYDEVVRESIAKMGECAARIKGAPRQEIDARVQEMFEGSRGGDARFRGDYEAALWSACRSPDSIRGLLAAVEPHIPRNEAGGGGEEEEGREQEGPRARKMSAGERRAAREGRKLLAVKAIALERLGTRAAAERMLSEHGAAGPDTYALYVAHLARSGRRKTAARMAWEGIYRFGDDDALTAAAFDALKGSRRGRCALSEWLYVRSHDPRHLARLKKESSSWTAARARLINELEGDRKHPERLLDLLVGEGMHKKALRLVVALGDMALLGHYRAALAARFPKAYLVAYWHGIERLADGARSAPAYKKIAVHLDGMARIAPGGKARARELAGLLCERHSNRPLMVKAIRGLRL